MGLGTRRAPWLLQTLIVVDIFVRLGHGDIEEEGQAAPLRVETLTMLGIHVVSVSCGAEHTIALCQEGVSQSGLVITHHQYPSYYNNILLLM